MRAGLILLFSSLFFAVKAQKISSPTHDTTHVSVALLYSNGLTFAERGFLWEQKDYDTVMHAYSLSANKPEGMSDFEAILWSKEEGNEYLTPEQKQEKNAWTTLQVLQVGYNNIKKGFIRSAETNMVLAYKKLQDHSETMEFLGEASKDESNNKNALSAIGTSILGEAVKSTLGMESKWDDIKNTFSVNAEYVIKKPIETKGLTRISKHGVTIVTGNLSLITATRGRYYTAEDLALKALEQRRMFFGEDHPATIASWVNLGSIHRNMGKWTEAQKEINKAVELSSKYLGTESYLYAISLNNQAMLMINLGQLEEAKLKLNKAIELRKKLPQDEDESDLQRMELNRALLLTELKDYKGAEKIYLTWLDNVKGRRSKKHPDYALLLNDLAGLYLAMGKSDQVPALLEEAAEIFDKKLNKRNYYHPAYLKTKGNLASYYLSREEYAKAGEILEQIVPQYKNTLQVLHPDVMKATNDLGIYYWKTGDLIKADNSFSEVSENTLKLAYEHFPYLSEQEREKFWTQIKGVINNFYAFSSDAYSSNPKLTAKVYDVHIATKGILLQNSTKIRNAMLTSNDTAVVNLYKEWVRQREMLAYLYSLSSEELKEEKIDVKELEVSVNNLERQIAGKSSLFSQAYSNEKKSWNDIKNNLTSGEGIVDVIRFTDNTDKSNPIKYMILTGGPDDTNPHAVVLKNGSELEGKYFKYYSNVMHNQLTDDYSYDIYWKPVVKSVSDKSTLYISLDGIYNKINLNSLVADGNYILDDKKLVFLPNSKNLKEIKNKKDHELSSGQAVLVGFPTYGKGEKVVPLPGTEKEVNEIQSLLKGSKLSIAKYTHEQASEQQIKRISQPKLLHVATHGFFLNDVESQNDQVFGIRINKADNNPLLKSGLMLAGAEDISSNNASSMAGDDNGILTAYEVVNLNLQNTELVVLSACETGLGEIKNGEGVYGLLRAFQLAGADAVIISLWKVDDDATQYLMTNFYKNYMASGNKHEAFRKAQLQAKQQYKHPYYWGAFMLMNN